MQTMFHKKEREKLNRGTKANPYELIVHPAIAEQLGVTDGDFLPHSSETVLVRVYQAFPEDLDICPRI